MHELNSLTQVNLNLLIPLKALLDKQNVTRAARMLNLTQSTMSRYLAQLRSIFNDPLLVRVGKGYALTPRALELNPALDALVGDLYALVANEFDPSSHSREFIFAAPDYVSTHVLGEAMIPLYSSQNRFQFMLVNWDAFAKQLLLEGELHLAMSLDDHFAPNIYRKIVDRDQWTCLMRCGHPAIADGEGLTMEKFLEYQFVAARTGGGRDKQVDAALQEYGCQRSVRLQASGYFPIFSILENSDFLAVIPEHVARNSVLGRNLHYEPLPFKVPAMRYSVWWHERFHTDAAHKWLRERILPNILKHPNHLGLSAGSFNGPRGR